MVKIGWSYRILFGKRLSTPLDGSLVSINKFKFFLQKATYKRWFFIRLIPIIMVTDFLKTFHNIIILTNCISYWYSGRLPTQFFSRSRYPSTYLLSKSGFIPQALMYSGLSTR